MNRMDLIVRYSLFAALAIAVNLVSQEVVLQIYAGQFDITLSIFAGTGAGLITKYYLDKNYIFFFQAANLKKNSKVFFLYTLMGILTTLIFWSFEVGFQIIFQSKTMRYLGAGLGLIVGYYIKYRLDRRFVFVGDKTYRSDEV